MSENTSPEFASPNQKGSALESAVAAIETVILQNSPRLREKSFVIENRKIIKSEGVHHEIDIFVTFDLAPGYKSIFIFECKNWQQAVGKNEIIVFSEKIDVANAQLGYFIAKSFTSDATAQAEKDNRVRLIVTKEHDPSSTIRPFGFHYTFSEIIQVRANFRTRGSAGKAYTRVDKSASKTTLDGQDLDWDKYFTAWAFETSNQDILTFPSGTLPDGTYDRTGKAERSFEKGCFLLDGRDIESISIQVDCRIHLIRPPVISNFELESRGRVVTLGPYTVGPATIQSVSIVSISPPEALPATSERRD